MGGGVGPRHLIADCSTGPDTQAVLDLDVSFRARHEIIEEDYIF